MELRNSDRFKSALTAALQLASGNKEIGDTLHADSQLNFFHYPLLGPLPWLRIHSV